MGGKTGTTSQSTSIPPEVLARYNSVNSQAQTAANQPFQQYSTDPNAFVAPLNQQQQEGVNNINQQAMAAQPAYGAALMGTAAASQGFNAPNYQQGVAGYMNPYLQNAMGSTAAMLQNQNQQEQQKLLGNTIQQGAFGGDRGNIAQAALMGQQNLAMGQTLGQMANQGYQQSAQNYMTGLQQQGALANQYGNLAGQAQQMGLAGAQAQLGAGTLGQQTTQAGNTALYNQFLQQQAYPFQTAQFLANIAEGTGALSGSQTTTTQPMSWFSDRRLKEDIKQIGKAKNGLPIYTFKYKGDPAEQTHVGFMADEVEKVHPEAVGLAGGYKTVDYNRAARAQGGLVGPQHEGMGFDTGGREHHAYGSAVGSDYYDPNSIQNIIARQQAMFANAESHHVPVARSLSGGINKYGRVPEGNLPVGALRTPSQTPQLLPSAMDEGLSAAEKGQKFAQLFSTQPNKDGSKGLAQSVLDAIKGTSQNAPVNKTQNPPTNTSQDTPTPPQKTSELDQDNNIFAARGGLMEYADGGNVTPEGLYSEDPKGGLSIPNENNALKYKMMQPSSSSSGSMQDPTAKDLMSIAALAKMFMATGGRAGYATDGAVEPDDILTKYGPAIGGIESSNKYDVLGPVTKSGDRAYGKYQVMGANIPSWTEEALGKKMSPDEFLADTSAQDKVFSHHFGKALNHYGNPQDAASVWFSGKPQAKAGNAQDQLGTTVPAYLKKFNTALGEADMPAKNAAPASAPTEGSDLPAFPTKGGLAGNEGYEAAKRALNPPNVWNDVGKGLGVPEKYQDSNLWVPALAGLGSMLSSRSPFLLPAVGEGLVGGASAYASLQPQQAQTEATRAGTLATLQAIPRENFLPNGDILVEGPNGRPVPMGPEEFRIRKLTDPNSVKLWNAGGEKGKGTATGLAGAAEGAASTEGATGLGAAKEIPAATAEDDPMSLTGEELASAKQEAIALTSKYPNVSDLQAVRPNLRNTYRKAAEEAAPMQRNNQIYADILTSRDPKDITAGGPYADWFDGIRSRLDQASRLSGGNGFHPAQGAELEEAQKLYSQLVNQRNNPTETATQLTLLAKTYPWLTNTNLGSAKNMSQIMVQTQADLDKNRLAQNLANATGTVGQYLPQGDYVGQNFADQFNKKAQPLQAKESAILEQMMTQPAADEHGDPFNDPKTGKPLTWFSLLSRYGGTLEPEVLKSVSKRFDDPYILRYFPNVKPNYGRG